jgi:hypothetical protein
MDRRILGSVRETVQRLFGFYFFSSRLFWADLMVWCLIFSSGWSGHGDDFRDKLGGVAGSELFHRASPVKVHGSMGNAEGEGDFLAGSAIVGAMSPIPECKRRRLSWPST